MLMPSICNDTAPQSIFESYSKRISIITSDIGGLPNFIIDREKALLFRAIDSENLANKIQNILDNRNLIAKFSSKIPRLKTRIENAQKLVSL